MANYTGPDSNNLLPGEPWTSQLALASFEDPIAIAEGAAGAPRLYLRSLEQLEAGDEIRARNDGPFTIGEPTALLTFGIIQTGTIRLRAEKTSGNGSIIFERRRNGVTTVLLNDTSNTAYTVDVAVLPGDEITLRVVPSASCQDFRISTNGQDLWPGPLGVRLEGNRNAT